MLLLILALSAAPAQPSSPTDPWQKFSPPGAKFAVELPGTPQTKTRKRWLPIGNVVSTVYKVETPPDTFGLSVTDLPGITFAFRSREKVIESTAEGFVEDAKAQQTGSRITELDGRAAKEVTYQIPANDQHPKLRGISRMLIDDKRLYIFYAEVSSAVTSQQLDRYFDSVQIPKAMDENSGR